MDAITEHIVVVANDDSAKLVAILDDASRTTRWLALDVQFDAYGRGLFDNRAVPLEAVLRNGKEWSAEGVEMGDGRSLAMNSGLVHRDALRVTDRQSPALLQPGREIVDRRQTRKETLNSFVPFRIVEPSVFKTVSFTSKVACCHGSKTAFPHVWLGCSVATTRSAGS